MRLILPYTDPEPDTVLALDQSGFEYEKVDVGGDDHAYWRLLNDLWSDGETFCVVEQDIVVSAGVLRSIDVCDHEWCAATYDYLGASTYAGMGCTRFRAQLINEIPDLMKRAGEVDVPDHGPMHWCTLDFAIQTTLQRAHRKYVCTGHGQVGHLSPTPSHGCCG